MVSFSPVWDEWIRLLLRSLTWWSLTATHAFWSLHFIKNVFWRRWKAVLSLTFSGFPAAQLPSTVLVQNGPVFQLRKRYLSFINWVSDDQTNLYCFMWTFKYLKRDVYIIEGFSFFDIPEKSDVGLAFGGAHWVLEKIFSSLCPVLCLPSALLLNLFKNDITRVA